MLVFIARHHNGTHSLEEKNASTKRLTADLYLDVPSGGGPRGRGHAAGVVSRVVRQRGRQAQDRAACRRAAAPPPRHRAVHHLPVTHYHHIIPTRAAFLCDDSLTREFHISIRAYGKAQQKIAFAPNLDQPYCLLSS